MHVCASSTGGHGVAVSTGSSWVCGASGAGWLAVLAVVLIHGSEITGVTAGYGAVVVGAVGVLGVERGQPGQEVTKRGSCWLRDSSGLCVAG